MTIIRTWLDRILRSICVVLFAALVILVVWQVFTRLVLNDPSPWTEEAARFVFVWASMIGIAIAVGEKADVVMDFLVEKLPRQLQRTADILAYLATLSFAVYVLIYGGLKQSALAWTQTNPLLPFTQGQLYLALPIAGFLLAFYLILHIIHALSPKYAVREGFHEDAEAAAT